jgi:hypothetical protein
MTLHEYAIVESGVVCKHLRKESPARHRAKGILFLSDGLAGAALFVGQGAFSFCGRFSALCDDNT